MKSVSRTPRRGSRAEMYRKAAERLVRHYPLGSCCAIYGLQHGRIDGFNCEDLDTDPLTSSYIRTMSESGTDSADFSSDMLKAYGAPPQGDAAKNHRVLSLLFMAAMVEAGDA